MGPPSSHGTGARPAIRFVSASAQLCAQRREGVGTPFVGSSCDAHGATRGAWWRRMGEGLAHRVLGRQIGGAGRHTNVQLFRVVGAQVEACAQNAGGAPR